MFGVVANPRTALFVITQTKYANTVDEIRGLTARLYTLGYKIFSFGFGENYDPAQVRAVVNNKKGYSMMLPIARFPLSLMTLQWMSLRSE